MAGLDSIRKFKNGGSTSEDAAAVDTGAEDSGSSTPSGGFAATAPNVKGQIGVKGPVYMNPNDSSELLKQMQRTLDERTGFMPTFLGGLKDAMAAGAGSDAMVARDRQKLAEQQDISNIRAQMAAYKSANAQQEAAKAQYEHNTGTGAQIQGAGGFGASANLANDPLVKAQLDALHPQDYVGRNAVLAAANKTEFGNASKARYDAALDTPHDFRTPDGKIVTMTPREYRTQYGVQGAPVQGTQAPAQSTVTNQDNKNPGNIRYGDFAKSQGAIGQTSTGIAVFPDQETGSKAHHTLLSGDKYGSMPLNQVPNVWAPKGDGNNDPVAYTKNMQNFTGFNDATMGKSYNQLTPAQQQVWREAQQRQEHGLGAPSGGTQQVVSPVGNAPAQAPVTGTTNKSFNTAEEAKVAGEIEKSKQEEINKNEIAKKKEYVDSIKQAESSVNTLSNLHDVSKNNERVFNLKGKGFGPWISWAMKNEHIEGKEGADPNDQLALHMSQEDQSTRDKIKKFSAEAQANFATNMVHDAGGGSRLTNADLTLGKIGKGVGPDTPFEAHMANLAKNLEAAKTVYYRGVAARDYFDAHPNASTVEFEKSPEYARARLLAARDVAQRFKDEKAAGYVHSDTTGKPYYIIDGKRFYL